MNKQQRSLLAAVTVTQCFAVGLTYGIFPVFLQPIELAFNASRTVVSSGQILLMSAMAIGGLAVGSALDKGYPRRIMITGALVMAGAFALAALSAQLWMLAIAAFAAGLTLPSVGPLVSAGLITRYFTKNRGKALGIMSVGPPLGSGIFAALAGFMLPQLGWQITFACFAVLCLLVLLPVIIWTIPVRFPVAEPPQATLSATDSVSAPDNMMAVVRQPVFFWTVLAYATTLGISIGWTVHTAAFLGALGLSTTEQSTVVALSFWMGIPGALLFGFLADKIQPRRLFALMIVSMACMLLTFSSDLDPFWLIAGIATLGFVTGGAIPLYTMLLGERVATENFGKAMGVSNLFVLPTMAFAVITCSQIVEKNQSYSEALLVLIVVLFLAFLCLLRSNQLYSALKSTS
ncbi:MAG: MFS transporter [Pseudomonadales bacterium]